MSNLIFCTPNPWKNDLYQRVFVPASFHKFNYVTFFFNCVTNTVLRILHENVNLGKWNLTLVRSWDMCYLGKFDSWIYSVVKTEGIGNKQLGRNSCPFLKKYWVGIHWGQSFLIGRRCLFHSFVTLLMMVLQ